jgi:sec-independent protein translocase protein TatA
MPFNLGFQELILLAAVALILFGPRRLPEIGKALGEGLATFKKAASAISDPVPPPTRPQVPHESAAEAAPAPGQSTPSDSQA